MIYVFDTSSFRSLKHFYPSVFRTIWTGLDAMVHEGTLISTREVWTELKGQNVSEHVLEWAKRNREIFSMPDQSEMMFVATIFKVPHFQSLIGEQQRLKGMPVADPFVIACAKIRNGTVVTEEQFKTNAAKIPNVCRHFSVPCIDLEGFMQSQSWNF